MCIPHVQDTKPLEHQQGERDDTFPKADREDGSGEGRVEMASHLRPGFSTRSGRLRDSSLTSPMSTASLFVTLNRLW